MAEAGESVKSSFDAQEAPTAQRLRRAKVLGLTADGHGSNFFFVADVLWACQGYPYARPHSSFIWCNGQALTFEDSRWTGPECLPSLPLDKPDTAGTPPAGVHIVVALSPDWGSQPCSSAMRMCACMAQATARSQRLCSSLKWACLQCSRPQGSAGRVQRHMDPCAGHRQQCGT